MAVLVKKEAWRPLYVFVKWQLMSNRSGVRRTSGACAGPQPMILQKWRLLIKLLQSSPMIQYFRIHSPHTSSKAPEHCKVSFIHKLKNKMTLVAGWESLRTGIHDSENLKQTFLDLSNALSKLSHLLNRAKTIKWYVRWMVCWNFLQERRKIRTGWQTLREY